MWVSGQYKICYLHNVSEQPIVEQAFAKVKAFCLVPQWYAVIIRIVGFWLEF